MSEPGKKKIQEEPASESVPESGGLGLKQLIQSIDEDILSALQAGAGREVVVEEEKEREYLGYFICFTLAGEPMAIPLASVQEAGQLQVVQKLPLLPDWIPGITIIRGEIVSVVHLERFLGKAQKVSTAGHPYLVIHGRDIKLAVIVDGIIGTRSLYRLHNKKSHSSRFFAGWAAYQERDSEKKISLFDVETFLSSPKLRNAATA